MGVCCSCTAVEACTVAELSAVSINYPSTLGNTVITEIISDRADGNNAYRKLIIGIAVAEFTTVNSLPTLLKIACDSIVERAVHLEYAALYVYLATVLIGAYKLAVNDLVVVSNLKLRKDGAPINYRLTGLTVGSVLITRLNRGSLFIKNGELSIVEVIRRRNGSKLGSYVNVTTEGRGSLAKSYLAINNVALYINNRSVVCVCCGIVISTGYVVVTVVGPDSHRDADDSVISSLRSIYSLNGNGKNLGNVIVSELNLESVSNDSSLCLPGVSIIELEMSHKPGKVRRICNVDINVVYRLRFRSLTGVIMSVKLYTALAVYNEGSGNLSRVAKLVLNLEGYGMSTGEKLYVTL